MEALPTSEISSPPSLKLIGKPVVTRVMPTRFHPFTSRLGAVLKARAKGTAQL